MLCVDKSISAIKYDDNSACWWWILENDCVVKSTRKCKTNSTEYKSTEKMEIN